jgi:hypothetical protein
MHKFTDFEPKKKTPAHKAWRAMRRSWNSLVAKEALRSKNDAPARKRARGRRMKGLSDVYFAQHGNIQARPGRKYLYTRGGGRTHEVWCLEINPSRRRDCKVRVTGVGGKAPLWVHDVDLRPSA